MLAKKEIYLLFYSRLIRIFAESTQQNAPDRHYY